MNKQKEAVRRGTYKLAVADFETTAAEFGKIPEAFCAGIMHEAEDNESPFYVSFWDEKAGDYIGPDFDYFRTDSAANQLFAYLDTLTDPHLVYFHNGGKFDIQYFAHLLPSQAVVYIGSRAVAVRYGIHEIRDSAAIVRAALRATGNKGTIDYKLHAQRLRGAHRLEIMRYLRNDCRVLLRAVIAFLKVACPVSKSKIPLTVSSAAFKQLLRTEKINMRKASGAALEIQRKADAKFRGYYFGGHVEVFDEGAGIQEGDFVLVDINSMYPYVMANYQHPIGDRFITCEHFDLTQDFWVPDYVGCSYFLEFEGTVEGLPKLVANKDGSKRNDYGIHTGTHKYHSHELRVALEFGLVQITKIIAAYVPESTQDFSKYVNLYYGMRIQLKEKLAGDRAKLREEYEGKTDCEEFKEKELQLREEFQGADVIAKLYLNGPYGKFAFDCNNYKQKHFVNFQLGAKNAVEYVESIKEFDNISVIDDKGGTDNFTLVSVLRDSDGIKRCGIGETNTVSETYYNVATAASITAAARGYLLRALRTCDTPLYCDTDSIICKGIGVGVPVSNELGHWKIEAECDRVVIAGRKLYAIWNKGNVVKVAAKGYSLDMSKGEELNKTALRIENALLADMGGELRGKGKIAENDPRLVKADFMAYKLGSKARPVARRLQASPDVLEKVKSRLAKEGITHADLYSEGTAHEIDGNAWNRE